MIKIYLRQAWTLMKQNKLFTGIYVVGTGLSIALVMTMFIIFYVKFAPIYPEYNRDRTLVLKGIKSTTKGKPENWNINGGVAYFFIRDVLPTLPHVEAVAGGFPGYWENYNVTLPGGELLAVNPRFADGGFWRVFTFRFLEGQPFTQADVEANASVAVLSASMARRLFATIDVVDRHITYNGLDFRVCGVVDDVSNATPESVGDLWIPLQHSRWAKDNADKNTLLGNVFAYLLVDKAENKDLVKREVEEYVEKFSRQNDTYEFDLMGQPDDYIVSTFRESYGGAPDMKGVYRSFLYMLMALLFIPALNLSGMISSRMGHRLCELGVRKAYGAGKVQLLGQVLCENLLLTLMGGVMGLLISYVIVLTASDWILTLFDSYIMNPEQTMSLTPEMLFNPAVFGIAFALCLVLNVISALIPAASALRHTIVQSLHTNR